MSETLSEPFDDECFGKGGHQTGLFCDGRVVGVLQGHCPPFL